nr:reverse transcriptase domain-containing protein [Tanacetum cinerariifolium]
MIRAIRINIPLIDVLSRMLNYGNFLKELESNKHKLEQISSAFLSDESSAIIQNKVPPKLRDPKSFLIPYTFGKTLSYNALSDLGVSINLMMYSPYAKLSLETLNPTKMSIRLADQSFQHLIGIAKTKLIDVIDKILKEYFDALLDEGSKILYSIEGTLLEDKNFPEFDEFIAMNIKENYESTYDKEEIPFEKTTFDNDYKIKKSLDEPLTDLELKSLPDHLEYA